MSEFLTKIIRITVFLGTLIGCSEANRGSDDSDAVSSPSKFADVSVLNAVAPYDAESQLSADILYYRLQQQEYAPLEDCIEAKGVPRIGLLFEQDSPEKILGTMLPDFPDMETLKSDGFYPVTEDDTWADSERNILSDAQQDAMTECYQEDNRVKSVQKIGQFYMTIRGRWDTIIDEIDGLDEIVRLREGFSTCAVNEGIAPHFAEDEDAFIGVLEQIGQTTEDLDEGNLKRKEMGQIYYKCGKDLWDRKIELRSGDRRDAFLDEHWDDIATLSEKLYGQGIIHEDEGVPDDTP